MNLVKLFNSLEENEKDELLKLAIKWRYPLKDNASLTTLAEFIKTNLLSNRLKYALQRYADDIGYIELLSITEIRKFKNIGKKSINEFISIRGY